MRIALVLTPPTNQYFQWAAQVGAADYVSRYDAVNTPEKMRTECERAVGFGLKLSVVEGGLPLNEIIHGGPRRDAHIDAIRRLVENMGQNGVKVLCYNWMPHNDWTRTGFAVPSRGGALTNEFNLADLKERHASNSSITSPQNLWKDLEYFLHAIIPVAEKAGVKLAMHPDDPPLPELLGAPQIMHEPQAFERLFAIAPSEANGMCCCGGVFSSMGENVAALVRRFGTRIHYAHFRDVRGIVPHFVETFPDEGQQNMAEVMRAYRDIGFSGPMRPDHVPKLAGEDGIADGYTMLGRLFAVGYLRGLMQATESEAANAN